MAKFIDQQRRHWQRDDNVWKMNEEKRKESSLSHITEQAGMTVSGINPARPPQTEGHILGYGTSGGLRLSTGLVLSTYCTYYSSNMPRGRRLLVEAQSSSGKRAKFQRAIP